MPFYLGRKLKLSIWTKQTVKLIFWRVIPKPAAYRFSARIRAASDKNHSGHHVLLVSLLLNDLSDTNLEK
jgi:hypothetical protein